MKRLFLSMALAAMAFTSVKAETINCTEITSVPTIITAQGIYCLKSDQSSNQTNGNIIDIQTNNVTIDLNGFKLGGLGAGLATHATGIVANNRKNITIRNGSIRGFFVGVALLGTSSSGALVEDLLLDGNRAVGIEVQGSGDVVRNNRVVNTGPGDVSTSAIGIFASGENVIVADNIVTGTSESVIALGISVSDATVAEVAEQLHPEYQGCDRQSRNQNHQQHGCCHDREPCAQCGWDRRHGHLRGQFIPCQLHRQHGRGIHDGARWLRFR